MPTDPLRLITKNNTRPSCITAAAGTELARASSLSNVIILLNERDLRQNAVISHVILLGQAFAHCPIFPTAASNESGPCLSPGVVVHPLRPTKHHWLGNLLHYQLPNTIEAYLKAKISLVIWYFYSKGKPLSYYYNIIIPNFEAKSFYYYSPVRHA